ncbi:MAG TPA: glycosyltransferase family 2 protein, partial [Bryobacteraceae bacterium]
MPTPEIHATIIVPVHNGEAELRDCLAGILRTAPSGCEVIVVDDASTDNSAAIAVRADVGVIRMPRRGGPAVARNRGAQVARGDILVFLDADVVAHPGTIARLIETLDGRPEIDAVFGAYDDRPRSPETVSVFRNLLHCYTHRRGAGDARTFWAGCGAIRRARFTLLGGFTTQWDTAAVEDIDLGRKLVQAGGRVVLDFTVQVQHLKRWTLGGFVSADVFQRAAPWTKMLLTERHVPNALNLTWSQRLSAMG